MRDGKSTTGLVVLIGGAVMFGFGMLLSASGAGACIGLPIAGLAGIMILVGIILLIVGAAGQTHPAATTTSATRPPDPGASAGAPVLSKISAQPPLTCTNCGSSLPAEAAFCTDCGTRIARSPFTTEA